MDSNNLFREKSLKRISSPEALNDYIKVANPGIWMLIVSIIIIMTGALVWSFFFHLEETIPTYAYTSNGQTIILINEHEISDINPDDKIKIDSTEYSISSIDSRPICISDNIDAYYLHIIGLSTGEWAYTVHINSNLEDGINQADIITNSFTPSSMIFN